jgi:uncharacterized membrane protein YidH (DUF202 family)
MLTRNFRAIALAAATTIALTAIGVTPASADRRNNNAAAIAAFAAIVGTIATIAIAEERRSRWEDHQRQRAYRPQHYGPSPYQNRPYYRPY